MRLLFRTKSCIICQSSLGICQSRKNYDCFAPQSQIKNNVYQRGSSKCQCSHVSTTLCIKGKSKSSLEIKHNGYCKQEINKFDQVRAVLSSYLFGTQEILRRCDAILPPTAVSCVRPKLSGFTSSYYDANPHPKLQTGTSQMFWSPLVKGWESGTFKFYSI